MRGWACRGFDDKRNDLPRQRADFQAEHDLGRLRGQCIAATYWRSVTLASGRYVVLDHGVGFSLAPRQALIEW
ncbi:hypothetical protein [Chitinasiproducens palmae]|uniref:hypothetical protein n=1 Tax=Chitinasiproducens palmae TaxID=1770053 RepID=UPI000B89D0EA|nr:hypothetical protein [Chitinasiproducens palmae]